MTAPLSSFAVQRARSLVRPTPPATASVLDLERLCGRLVELSEPGCCGALSALAGLLTAVQRRREVLAWVEAGKSVFYPPDLAALGLDLDGVSVVWAPDALAALQSAEWLLRSGAFGLVVIDGVSGEVEASVLGRLGRLAAEHRCVALFLTTKGDADASLGPLVSLRVGVSREGATTVLRVLKDKLAGPLGGAPAQRMVWHGPLGLY